MGRSGLDAAVQGVLGAPAGVVLVVVGAVVLAEAGLFLGFVLPGELAAILGGVAAAAGHVPLGAMIATVVVAAIVGDLIGFSIGRRLGPRLVHARVLARRADDVRHAQERLRRRGAVAVVLARWVAFLRALMPALAGASGMRLRTFVPADVLGAGLWGPSMVLIGYLAGSSYASLERDIDRVAFAVVAVALVVGVVAWRRQRSRVRRAGG